MKSRVSHADVKRLARSLLLLTDPFPSDDPSTFKATLVSKEYSDLEKLVQGSYFADADFHLIATTDIAGFASAEVVDWKGDVLFKADHKDVAGSRKGAPYHCPPVTFDLWVYLLSKDNFLRNRVH